MSNSKITKILWIIVCVTFVIMIIASINNECNKEVEVIHLTGICNPPLPSKNTSEKAQIKNEVEIRKYSEKYKSYIATLQKQMPLDMSDIINELWDGWGLVLGHRGELLENKVGKYCRTQQEYLWKTKYASEKYIAHGVVFDIHKDHLIIYLDTKTDHYLDVYVIPTYDIMNYRNDQKICFYGQWSRLGTGIVENHRMIDAYEIKNSPYSLETVEFMEEVVTYIAEEREQKKKTGEDLHEKQITTRADELAQKELDNKIKIESFKKRVQEWEDECARKYKATPGVDANEKPAETPSDKVYRKQEEENMEQIQEKEAIKQRKEEIKQWQLKEAREKKLREAAARQKEYEQKQNHESVHFSYRPNSRFIN